MVKRITFIFTLLAAFTSIALAQCPSSGGPFCYSQTSTVVPVAVDICPTAGMAVQVTITAGQVENSFDELQVFCGPMGSGTGGTQIYNAYGTGGNLAGLVFTCAIADDCMSIYVNSDVSVTCATNGFTPITYDVVCVAASCAGTVSACYGNNQTNDLLLEICPATGFAQVDIEFLAGEVEVSFDDLDIYSGPSGSGTTGTQLFNDLDGDLTGVTASGVASGDCIILIISSDGSVSCASSSSIDAMSICVTSSVPLPVTLLSFDAVAGQRANHILWRTASEYNTERHVVERSSNGKGRWETIGEVPAAGFTNAEQDYRLSDSAPMATSYYRLRSVDFDGSDQLSEVVVVERAASGFRLLQMNPVPVSSELNIQFELGTAVTVRTELISLTGQVLSVQELAGNRGLNQATLATDMLPSGVYLLSLTNDREQIVRRIVKN